ncbi:MAG TPA: chain length determinant protein tyrosine kinase EpsG [Burkholderiales bacterium]|nr:chain length determinant protein tyrosine kinase EpsG [Burkholderiales bacterium]
MSIPGEKINVYSGPARPARTNAHIGALLVDAGKLTSKEAERVMQLQREKGIRFGDAAVKLGLTTRADIDRVLAQQFEFPFLVPGTSSLSGDLVAAYAPFEHKVEAFRAVRSQLMLRWFNLDIGLKHLAIVSPHRAEGRSYFAANLAVVFSQLGERTLLIDADMRHPCQHLLFDLENRAGLSTLLAGRAEANVIERIVPLLNLSILPAGPIAPNPQELLGRPLFPQLLDDLAQEYDVIILDTPAGVPHADAQTIAARAGGAFLIARLHHTPVAATKSFSNRLTSTGAVVVGAVVNTA